MSTKPVTLVVPRNSGVGGNPRVVFVYDGKRPDDFQHPRSGARHVTRIGSAMPRDYEAESDPMRIDLDDPPTDQTLRALVTRCEQAFGNRGNVPESEYDVPYKPPPGEDAWFQLPNPHAAALTSQKKIDLKLACDDSGNLWIVHTEIQKGSTEFSRLRHVWRFEGGLTEGDLEWLRTSGFPGKPLPWCVTDIENLHSAPPRLYEQLRTNAVNCFNRSIPDKRCKTVSYLTETL